MTDTTPAIVQGQGIRILLIEDDEDDYIIARDLLRSIESTRYEIDWKSTFEEGLSALEQGEYDVCIVDYRLGRHDGVEFVSAANQRGWQLPIILLTGQEDRTIDFAAMGAGAADFLGKAQITSSMLERSIRYSIQQRRTEQQRLELVSAQIARHEAEAANAAKDQFLATLSHELRTPLNAILGWAQLLRMPDLDEQTRNEAVQAIERNSKAQARLIDDLLDISRIISGKVRIQRQPLVLRKVIQAAIESVRPLARDQGVKLEPPVLPSVGILLGDATRLQQVVWNLLTNAIKFTPAGGWVRLDLGQRDNSAVLTVSDNGQGIPAHLLARIFDRYRQVDHQAAHKQTGLGLGLAIVRHLVSMHGGKVRASSAGENQGATFTVELPLLEASQVQKRLTAPNAELMLDQNTLARVRLLVVDDQRDTLVMITRALQIHGGDVAGAESVSQAMEQYVLARPDVVISDLSMPREDGCALARRIRAMSGGEQVLMLAVSAHTGEQDRLAALSAGFDACLAKPIVPTDLITAIARLIFQS